MHTHPLSVDLAMSAAVTRVFIVGPQIGACATTLPAKKLSKNLEVFRAVRF
jgi:hypothetical protein